MIKSRDERNFPMNQVFQTQRISDSLNNPLLAKAMTIVQHDENSTIKVRAKSLFRKKESEVGILEKAIMDDYQNRIQNISKKPATSPASPRKKISEEKLRRRMFPTQTDLHCYGMVAVEDVFIPNSARTQIIEHKVTAMSPSFKRIVYTPSTRSKRNQMSVFPSAVPINNRLPIMTASSAHKYYLTAKKKQIGKKEAEINNDIQFAIENTAYKLQSKIQQASHSSSIHSNPYRKIFNYKCKKYSYYHIV
jgi:hypothetical protein